MKFYLKFTHLLNVCIFGLFALNIFSSCQIFKANSDMITITEASYYKTFGGQGRSRNLNFEITPKESLALIDAIYWLEVDGFKVDLKLHQKGDDSLLIGYYTEYRSSREKDYDANSLFNKVPFTDVVLKVQKSDETIDITIKELKNKPTKYYP